MLKLGINHCSNENYHGDRKFKSSSTLKLFLKDPKEYYKRYISGEPREEIYKSAYDFGSYMHSIILEPEKTDSEFAIFDGATRRGKAYEEFKSANEGKTIIIKFFEFETHIRKFFNSIYSLNLIIYQKSCHLSSCTFCYNSDYFFFSTG